MPKTMQLKVQKGVFDLDTFTDVTLVKEFDFEEVESVGEALSRVGNDQSKLLAIVNEGLKAEARRQESKKFENWRTFNEEGEVNGAFTGTIADSKAVNALVLTLAKTVFGYSKDLNTDQKRQAKQNAENMIKNTPAIREGLKKSAAPVDNGNDDAAENADNNQ